MNWPEQQTAAARFLEQRGQDGQLQDILSSGEIQLYLSPFYGGKDQRPLLHLLGIILFYIKNVFVILQSPGIGAGGWRDLPPTGPFNPLPR